MHILILPGWMHTSEHWKEVTHHLQSEEHSVEVLDIPGFGAIPADSHLDSKAMIIAYVEDKLAHHTEPIVVCGHSFGGRIAVELAVRGKVPIAQLFLIASPNLYHPTAGTKLWKTLANVLTPIKNMLPETVKRPLRSDDYQAAKTSVLAPLFSSVLGDNQSTALGQVKQRTHLIWGELDSSVPLSVGTAIDAIVQNSELIICKGVGHNIHLEKPSWLAATILNHVKA